MTSAIRNTAEAETSQVLEQRIPVSTIPITISIASSTTATTSTLTASSAASSSQYQYAPVNDKIDSIRVLVLHPATNVDPQIRCSLVHKTFREKPIYEALSYMWGTDNPTNLIYIDRIQCYARENLYHALCGLRQESPRNLWVDALCIDQENLKERAKQVELMDFIYARASTVLVWLGPEIQYNGNATTARHFLSSLDDNFPDWIIALCKHPYWRRLWIVQEICLARSVNVCIGTTTMGWGAFVLLFPKSYVFSMGDTEDQERRDQYHTGRRLIHRLSEKRLGRHGDSNQLEVLLEDFQYALCQDRRDNIYGLLGLAHDCFNGLIRVDYNKSHYGLYCDMIRYFLEKRFHASDADNKLDRSTKLVKFSRLIHRLLKTSYLERDHLCPPSVIVHVYGSIVSQVLHIGPTYEEMISPSKASQEWTASFTDYDALPHDIMRRREANEAYMRALTSQDVAKIHNVNPNDAHHKLWSRGTRLESPDNHTRRFHGIPVKLSSDNALGMQTRNISTIESSSSTSSTGTHSQSLRRNSSRLGLVPGDTRVGDYICQFWETDVAALLRKEGDLFRIVGRVDLCRGNHTIILKDRKPFYVPWNNISFEAKQVEFQMDLDLLSFLTC